MVTIFSAINLQRHYGKWPEAMPQKAACSHSQQDGQLLQNSVNQVVNGNLYQIGEG